MNDGMNILLLDTKRNNANHYIVLSILAALKASPSVANADKVDYSEAIIKARRMRYDVLLAVDGEAINIDILRRLTTLVGKSALWAWEDPYELTTTSALASLFDFVFTNDAGSVGAYPQGALHLPLAASKYIPVIKADCDYSYDLSFIGSAWPNRVVFLRKILRAFPHLRTRIMLHYNPFIPRAYLDLPESSYTGALSNDDFLGITNRSRVNLTLHREFSGDGKASRAHTPGPRIFEAGLAGGFQLVDGEGMHVEGFYKPDLEIDVFESFQSCIERLRNALDNPTKRIAVAEAAQAKTLAQHTYTARIALLLEAVKPLPKCQPVYTTSEVVHSARRPRVFS